MGTQPEVGTQPGTPSPGLGEFGISPKKAAGGESCWGQVGTRDLEPLPAPSTQRRSRDCGRATGIGESLINILKDEGYF